MNAGRIRPILKCLSASALAIALIACGNNTSTVTTATPLTVSALSGTYIYTVVGTDPNDGDYSIAGSLTADGKGAVTSAVADYNLGSGIDANVIQKGTYTVSGNVATVVLTDGAGVSDTYTVGLTASPSTSIITKSDGTGTGTIYAPVASAASSTGSYTFVVNGEQQGTVSASGSFTAGTGGTFTAGTETFTDANVPMKYASITGFLYPIQSTGRGMATIGGNYFSYYLSASNQIILQGLDDRALLYGIGTKQ